MTSRRQMIRSYSGNGRTSSFSEDEGSSNGRSESRNPYLSNVRPENRSTLCTVMAQLTEDVQPSFEKTLKSKAVSENCNVKFICVVSGYPAPEMKWYKDDMEMDRYCGLPKYEIRRNGKTHTLHIYNCTLDDAAIYQVSASNSKGIVSCSGVLEVGDMNEYKIHQRFFAKLKQNAENKKKNDMEVQTKKEDKENIQKEKQPISPERPPRKRHGPPPEEMPSGNKPGPMEQGATAEANGIRSDVKETASMTTKDGELDSAISVSEKASAIKKIKISNGLDTGVNSSNSSRSETGNGGENCYDGGIGLAQFLAETLQSQATEEKQSSLQENEIFVLNASKENNKEQQRVKKEEEEQKRQQKESERPTWREDEISIEKERERDKPLVLSHTKPHTKHGSEIKQHSKTHKDHDHHNIQASISSMLHTVKDFLFGKSKKDSDDHFEAKERVHDHSSPSQPEMPPSFQLQQEYNQASKAVSEDVVPMDIDKPNESSEILPLVNKSESVESHEHENHVLNADVPQTNNFPPECMEQSGGQSVKKADDTVESMEVSAGPESSNLGGEMPLAGLQVLTEADFEAVSVVTTPDCLHVSSPSNNQAARDESSPTEDESVSPETQVTSEEKSSPTHTLSRLEESWTLPQSLITGSETVVEVRTDTFHGKEINVKKMGKGVELDTEELHSATRFFEEEKVEVKATEKPHADINRCEITELGFSSEARIEPGELKTLDQVLVPVTLVATPHPEEESVKEATAHVITIEETKVRFSLTAATGSLDKGDLAPRQENGFSKVEESPEAQNLRVIQSPNADESETTALQDLEVKSHNSCKTQGVEILEPESSQSANEEKEQKDPGKAEKTDDSNDLSETQNRESHAVIVEEHRHVAQQDSSVVQHWWPSDNIPEIQISTIEDIPDIKTAALDLNPNERFIIPQSELVDAKLRESTLPLTIMASNQQESESASVQTHDVTQVSSVIIQQQGITDSSTFLPSQKCMPNAYELSSPEEVKEVEQADEKMELFEQELPQVKDSQQLAHIEISSAPVVSVSCSDHKDDDVSYLDTHRSNASQMTETPSLPLFVVPPICVTSHESECTLRLSTQNESIETDASVAVPRGTKCDVDNNGTVKLEKPQNVKQNLEEMADKQIKESTPSLLCNALLPKVCDNGPFLSRRVEDEVVPEIIPTKNLREAKTEEDLQRTRSSVERLVFKPPTHPSLSPSSLRKFMSKAASESDIEVVGGHQSDKTEDDLSGGSTPTSPLSCESSPRLKRRDSLSLIRSATPEELASGARRKIFIPKPKEDGERALDTGKKDIPYMSPGQARRAALLQCPTGQNSPQMERHSPLLSRRKATLEVPKFMEEPSLEEPAGTKREEKLAEKRFDPLKAPQVIRKIRAEPFPDASGHLKLWCQFFNILSESTIKWYREEEEILQVKKSGGDESQVALAIVLASRQDCGVYGCSISNEYGADTTDFLLSIDILSEILLRDDLGVGEEIEMTPLLFTKGLADCGSWGEKYFGRIMTETVHIGKGCAHKASRVRVIYGLDPIFESGSSCIIKVQNPIAYGTKQENNLTDRNGEITKQECKVQNMIREYCKIFAAEARVSENFGSSLEVIPRFLMYRPANSVPYATVEADLKGDFLKYCMMDPKGTLITQTVSEVEQKCSTFQHWIHQWTHGNLLVTQMEGVETKITNIRVVTKSKGYQGLTESGSPQVFEQFLTHHQCNYYCGLLGLKPLKTVEGLQQFKTKGSRSPLLNRKLGSSSPQLQRKGQSPQMLRKANSSPKVARKVQETEENKSGATPKHAETDVAEMR